MKILTLLSGAWLALSTSLALAAPVSEVSQFGITWKFDRPYEVGQFANGDYWVVGPVTITEITPATAEDRNGSMLNPAINGAQGFDARIRNNEFDPALNVAAQLPLAISEPSSLLSCISLEEASAKDDPQMETIAVLTILNQAPEPGSFRPPYQGTDKTILGNANQLNFGALGKFARGSEGSDPTELAEKFARPWIELKMNWTGRYMHPKENQPPYGRDLAHLLGAGLLTLQLDYTDEEKRPLLINLTQVGLDIYGAAREGANWHADGGHNQGRKLPLLLAGTVLGNSQILEYGDARKHMIFQEDQQTFYVTQEDIDRPRDKAKNPEEAVYPAEMLGKPEWGIRHSTRPEADSYAWSASYRVVSGAPTFTHALAARLMGLEEAWGHPAFFDYYDRYWEVEKDTTGKGPNGITLFAREVRRAHGEKSE